MAPRAAAFRQSDITRAVKGAQAAGLGVAEVIATKDSVRIIAVGGERDAREAVNPWDCVLNTDRPGHDRTDSMWSESKSKAE